MVSEQLFRQNLELYHRTLPNVAKQILSVDPSEITFCQTREGEPNLKKEVNGKVQYFHSNYSAQKEAQSWFSSLHLEGTQVLFVYGVGLGYYHEAAKEWLSRDVGHYLVFIEDDLAVLRRLFETERGKCLLEDPQVQLHYFDDFDKDGAAMFEWLCWFFILLHFDVSALRLYEQINPQRLSELRLRLFHDSVRNGTLANEYMHFSRPFFHNFYINLAELPHSHHGNALFGKFKGVPAIICGAGPSLAKNLDVLKTLDDRALIFAGGSSLNVLSANGFLPHFGAGIDPNPAQRDRLASNLAFELPFFYRSRMCHSAFSLVRGPRLYLNGCGGYPVADWFDEKLALPGNVIDEGCNVVNMCVEVAHWMGCNPIIFVGMDLAYTDMKIYAPGVSAHNTLRKEDITTNTGINDGGFLRNDIYGKPIYTLWKWVGESQWISAYAAKRPENCFVNATEGGLGIPNIPNMTLQEVADKYLKETYDLHGRVHCEIQNARISHITREKVEKVVGEMKGSLETCLTLCNKMHQELLSLEKKVKKKSVFIDPSQSPAVKEIEAQLEKEPAHKYILSVISAVHVKTVERRRYQIGYDKTLRTDLERKLRYLSLNGESYAFLKQAAEANVELIQEAFIPKF